MNFLTEEQRQFGSMERLFPGDTMKTIAAKRLGIVSYFAIAAENMRN